MIATAVKWAFGGGIGYVQGAAIVGLVGFVGYHWTRYHNLETERDELRTEVFWNEIQSGWDAQVIAALATTQDRRAVQQTDQLTLEDILNALPETNDCAASPAIRAGLDSLRNRRSVLLPSDP